MALPTITINFYNQALEAVARSASGIMAVCLKKDDGKVTADPTETEGFTATYYSKSEVEADTTHLNAVHRAEIGRCFYKDGAPKKVIVSVSAAGDDALEAIEDQEFSWVCCGSSDTTFGTALITAVKAFNANTTNARKIKLMAHAATCAGTSPATSDEHIVGVQAHAITLNDNTSFTTTTWWQFLPRVCAVATSTPITESITYKVLPEVKTVSSTGTTSGNFVNLVNMDGMVRVSKGVATNNTSIAIVEAKDIINEDIVLTFRNFFLGRKRNTMENELSFCAQVLGYFKQLQAQGVINPNEDIACEQDVDAMRTAHAAYYQGKDNNWVKAHPYGTEVYITCSMRLVDVMEDLTMSIYLG